ncbi:peptide chain release factor N(5)-glutamine methyltransferase [Coraliomargarita algicola]|uniref:Release factor glutamine methyltransferase n=1 Tax=Coraliomargarita algicola TaxID=3092156 RepID=A0ABZ0RH29_9BACT|nr:peptide chain release factor N(5)-glutamine methyltransferase [Coraliomargarita sp. J2-16]WPJ94085.1 peptide chain release factor N(5)-glutamine methyltransferase [Coraliomargarita sp. J2-16]
MLSIREIKARTETFFKEKGVPNAKLDTDILIAHSLGMKRLELYLDLDRPLTEAQLSALRPLVKRRANREPLQYIVGNTDFYGLQLKVDRRALIPRHETEELIELIVERLQATPQRILDLGTGSGALALALATQYPEAQVVAVDQSTEALELARENASALELNERVQFLAGSWWTPLMSESPFDLIVSNPPYLTEAEMQTAEPEVIQHEPHSALVAGTDGLDDFRVLLEGAPKFLAPGGLLAMETGIAQSEALSEMAQLAGLQGQSIEDLSGRPRFFFAS